MCYVYLVLLCVVGICACYLVLCSTTCYSYLVLRIVLQVPSLCTPGTTAPHNRTYPEYSWSVLCVVSGYAVGVLCYVLLVVLYAMYYITLSTVSIIHVLPLMVTDLERLPHHLAMLYAYTEVWRILLIGPWLRR